MWKIRDIEIPNRIVAAPMAGVTNVAFRGIVKRHGAGLVYAEMVSDKGLFYENERTLKMLKISAYEHPVSMQIFGGELETLVEAAKIIDTQTDADIIDINMGCPVPKIIKSGAGSKLLQNPEETYHIVKAIVAAVKKPVTVKMRVGWDAHHVNAVEMAQMLEKAGVSAIALHGRTRSQMYEGKADWSIIKEVKQAVRIPVIGNGDVATPEDAKRMLDETGCDAVMIGRGALGNPWVFERMNHYVNTGELLPEPSPKERIQMCIHHSEELIASYEDEEMAIREMRSHAPWYLKGLHHANRVKAQLSQIKTIEEMKNILHNYELDLIQHEAITAKGDIPHE